MTSPSPKPRAQDTIRTILSRVVSLFRNRRLDADLDEELRAHIHFAAEENIRRGMTPEQAHNAALRSFGGVTQTKEQYRMQRGLPWFETLILDARYALRQLRKSPAFTLTTALILTLGIGINTAIFSIVHHILLEPLPFPQPDRLQALWARSDSEGSQRIAASGPDFLDYHDQNRSFSQIAMTLVFTETWTGDGEPQLLLCTGVSEDYFSMLGIQTFMGRFYTADEYSRLESGVILISYRFWKTKLGGDPHVLGRVIHIGGAPNTIVGVTPPMPDLKPEPDVWPTITTHPSWPFMQWRNNKFLTVTGRLKPQVTPAMAEAELTTILRRAPGEPSDVRVQLTPLRDDLVGKARTQLQIVMLAAALVLLATCINVAALVSARSARRFGEMALRLSLGAGQRRLRQQLLVEAFVLTVLACAPGVLLAGLALRFLPYLPGLDLPRLENIHLNASALLVTGLVAAATTLFFGWAPSFTLSALNLASSLRSGRADTGKAHHRSFSALVIAEIACSMVLSVCAALLLHSYWRLAHVDPGFEPDHMLTTYLRTNYYASEGRSFWRDVLQGVSTLPGVRAAALADCTPGQNAAIATLVFHDRPNDPNRATPAEGCWSSSGFFRVSGTPLLQGRLFTPSDDADSAPVAIINQQAAQEYWPGENPIGKMIGVNYTGPGRVGNSNPRMRQIVGIVQGMKHGPLELPTGPAVYMPYLQDETGHDMATMSLFVRTASDPHTMENSIRTRIHAVSPQQPVDAIQTMQDIVSQSLASRRYSLSLLAAFAALALLLSAVGIYGIVSYTTLQRTREFGIRIAVGATRGNVMSVVFRHGMVLTLAGSLIGIGAAFLIARALTRLLFQISPLDTPSFISSAVLIGLISAAACVVPALRAARVDPARALRSE